MPAPAFREVEPVVVPALRLVTLFGGADFDSLWRSLAPEGCVRLGADPWVVGRERALIDAVVAASYGLTLPQYAAVLSTFPNLDRSQPMLPGEPKCFVTRDLALLAFCELTDQKPVDVGKLMREIGVDLPEPANELRTVERRVDAYRGLGAVPYRPTPKGGTTPTDPAFIDNVVGVLDSDPKSVSEVAEALDADESAVSAVLKRLAKDGDAFSEGTGRRRRYYVVEDD